MGDVLSMDEARRERAATAGAIRVLQATPQRCRQMPRMRIIHKPNRLTDRLLATRQSIHLDYLFVKKQTFLAVLPSKQNAKKETPDCVYSGFERGYPV